MSMKTPWPLGLAAIALIAGATVVRAETTTWNGGTGNWTDANWDNGAPQAGDAVVINTGTILLSNATPSLSSLAMGGGTLVFTNWSTKLTATNVTINSGATVTLPGPFTNAPAMSNRVWIACSNLTVASGGSIDVDGMGYDGQNGPGQGKTGSNRGAGAGHGGRGGNGNYSSEFVGGRGGLPYGSTAQPVTPGSGGTFGSGGSGGAGGGAVRIQADGTVTVDGTLTARGQGSDGGSNSGGGSGGSIYVTCRAFAGNDGTILANGGPDVNYGTSGTGGGGGGRIAIDYDPTAQAGAALPDVDIRALHEGDGWWRSELGTIWLTDNRLLTPSTLANFRGELHGFTTLAFDSLSLTNVWLRFGEGGFVLTITNDLTVSGSDGRLDVGGNATMDYSYEADLNGYLPPRLLYNSHASGPALRVGGDLTLTNGARLHVHSVATNGSDYGAEVAVTGSLVMATGCWVEPVSHPTNGGAPRFVVQDLSVATNAGFAAEGAGYADLYGPGKGTAHTHPSGGGHGGEGGPSDLAVAGGGTYGVPDAPVTPGSPGGPYKNLTSHYFAGWGGGVVRISARGSVRIDGTVDADGGTPYLGRDPAAGAGGSIFLECGTLQGSGWLTANGGDAKTSRAGGGGGGRIAIWQATDTSSLTVSVAGGTGWSSGTNGTIVWVKTSPTITNLYATNITEATAWLVGSLTATGTAPTDVTCYWGTNNGSNVKGNWHTNDTVGPSVVGLISNSVSPLTAGTLYYYRFYATNANGGSWASPSIFFSTPGGGIQISNDGGATDILTTSATLRGNVTLGSPDPDTYVCWGDNNPGSDSTSLWDRVEYVGTQLGAFQTNVTGLLANKTYYYRCYAANAGGDGWAATVSNFTTAVPTMAVGDPAPIVEGDAGTQNLDFTVTLSATSGAPVTVVFAASNGLATAGVDFGVTNGVLTIPASNTAAATITVLVNGDTDDEYPYEDLYLNLSTPTNATLTDSQAYARITDNDETSQTKTWTGTGDWFTFTNWSPTGTPGPSDDVILGSGSTLLTGSVTVAGLTVNTGATLTFSNWTTKLTAGTVLVDGTVAVAGPFAAAPATSNRVWLACSGLTVSPTGLIDADGKGYRGDTGPGVGFTGVNRGAGGGYGGMGGHSYYGGIYSGGLGGFTYGSVSAPAAPGSGGGDTSGGGGCPGGGAIRIEATGGVTVEGTLTASGEGNQDYGGGSGGAIYITSQTLHGTGGVLRVQGGNGKTGSGTSGQGGGGGGRISVQYDPTAQSNAPLPDIRFLAGGGTAPTNIANGDLGTIALPDSQLLTAARIHNFVGQLRGFPSWSAGALTLTNGWRRFSENGFKLTADALTLSGSDTRLDIGGDDYVDYRSVWASKLPGNLLHNSQARAPRLSVSGGVTLSDGAELWVMSAATNATNPETGARVDVGGAVTLSAGSWVCPVANPTNGGAPLFVVGSVTADAGSGFDATGRGFADPHGPGLGTTSIRPAGGGHGGRGGDGILGYTGGGTYGASNAPVTAGSPGGTYSGTARAFGGWGGGTIRIEATGAIAMDGTLAADGRSANVADSGGGGAGGGIYLRCSKVRGAGLLSTTGGDANPASCGAGGGGRIAVWSTRNTFVGTANVTNGNGYVSVNNAQPGTIVWGAIPAPGTIFLVR